MNRKSWLRIFGLPLTILVVPLVAMTVSDEVNWGLADFVIIGTLLLGAMLIYELLVRNVQSRTHRIWLGAGLVIAVLYIWAELAVGIFTTLGS